MNHEQRALKIRKLRADGLSRAQVAHQMGVSTRTVTRALADGPVVIAPRELQEVPASGYVEELRAALRARKEELVAELAGIDAVFAVL